MIRMRIERIDDKTVKCFLSNEELEEYQIDYKDFVMRSEKAKEIVQEIMEHAEEEVGYKPPKFAFDLQIMMLPDQGLVLTFSEKDPEGREGEQLAECLREMKRVLQAAREKVGLTEQNKEDGQEAHGQQETAGQDTAGKQAAQHPAGYQKGRGKASGKAGDNRPTAAVFAFSGIGRVLEYAAVLPASLRVDSSLYSMNGYYYLYLRKGHAAYERYSRACIQAMEFGGLCTADEKQILMLKEHGECLVEEKALRKLKG